MWHYGHFSCKDNATGDGGMITTNDKELLDKCRELTWFGVSSTWSKKSKVNHMLGTMK